ncbi:hypothetical protein KUTeg_024476 [Tegillarca granosa]|uniref:RING-type domain-containing protein n=1 Tax=Tegillarca granosa TaxID=220873 RepID=A0ABQ9E345_TEGGR|nr:hypothetical protein KUTeg_024476 [Tegillarca granosa]
MATSALDTELTCSICLEFYRDPYLLPCMHSFCKQCLIEFSKPNQTSEVDPGCSKSTDIASTEKDENVLECPECRQTVRLDHKGIDGLPKNFTLANIVKKYAKQEDKEEKKYPCDICDNEQPNDAVKCCLQCGWLYCRICLAECHPNKRKLKSHTLVEPSDQRRSETLSTEDSKIVDNLLKSVNNLEIIKRKVERNIRDIQTNIDSLQATGGRKKNETQVVFDRLVTMLKTKERRFISEVDKEVNEKTDALILQLSSWRQFAEDIDKMIKDVKIAVDDFPRKTTNTALQTIRNRIFDMEKKPVNFDKQNFSNKHGKRKKNHIWNINVELIPTRNGASISVAWTKIPDNDLYDVSVESTLQNGIKERSTYSCVQGSRHKIDNLRQDTAYRVYVAVHGETDTESRGVIIQTLKCVPCTPFTINGKCADESTFVSEDSKIMMPEDASERCSTKYTRLFGTIGTIEISSGSLYWETKCSFSFVKGMKKGDYVFDIGTCYKTTVDRINCLYKNFSGYSVNVVKRGNRDIQIEFVREGRAVIDVSEDVEWEERMILHLGFYLNVDKRKFSVINVTENRVIYTFEDIKTKVPHVPVFSHGNFECKPYVEIQLLTGLDILEVPSCLLEVLKDQSDVEDYADIYFNDW